MGTKIRFWLTLTFSWIAGCAILIVIRLFWPTTLLFDQFCLITLLVGLISKIIFDKWRIEKLPTESIHRKNFLSAICVALLFFSIVQYSVLAVDRSRSLYIFKWVNQGLVKIHENEIIFDPALKSSLSTREDLALKQRIQEQKDRLLMDSDGQKISLTFLGTTLLTTAEMMAKIFNLKGWYEGIKLTKNAV